MESILSLRCEIARDRRVRTALNDSHPGTMQTTYVEMILRRNRGRFQLIAVGVRRADTFALRAKDPLRAVESPGEAIWQLASPLDEKLVRFVSKDYAEPGGQMGKEGVEK